MKSVFLNCLCAHETNAMEDRRFQDTNRPNFGDVLFYFNLCNRFACEQDACREVHSACRREVNRHKLDICILRLRQERIPGIFVCRSKFPGLKVGYGVPLRTKIRPIIFQSKSTVFAVEVEYFEFEVEYFEFEVEYFEFEVEYIKIEVENI